jgi:hypothetical protein
MNFKDITMQLFCIGLSIAVIVLNVPILNVFNIAMVALNSILILLNIWIIYKKLTM